MNRSESILLAQNDISKHPNELIIRAAMQAAIDSNLPIVMWSQPRSPELHLMVSFSQAQVREQLDLEECEKGFGIKPFNSQSKSLFLSADFHCSFLNKQCNTDFEFSDVSGSDGKTKFLGCFFELLEHNGQSKNNYHLPANPKIEVDLPDYQEVVHKAIAKIKSGVFQKVVPARKKEIQLEETFDVVKSVEALISEYPDAFISMTSIPKVGTWLGATPEVLLEVDDKKTFKTMALAATQKKDPSKAPSETAWTQKEIEEQAMVSRYIINCFKKIRLREFEEKGPKTIAAGNLLHLKTDYEVDMQETNFPQLGTVMLDLLHPTSAVAGMPKTEALEFLEQHEGFDREFFSGFLGPINIEQNTNLFVNLRCMQLFENSAILYAGAGVTEDSIPEKELLETEMKFNTLLNVINRKA